MVITTLIVMITVNRKWRAQLIIWSIILIPFLISILSLYQLLNEGSIFTPIVRKVATEIGMPVYRSTGTFSNPNALGCFLMVGLIPGFALLFQKKQSTLIRLVLIISIAFTSVALLISFSRGSWLSTATGILLIVILHFSLILVQHLYVEVIFLIVQSSR